MQQKRSWRLAGVLGGQGQVMHAVSESSVKNNNSKLLLLLVGYPSFIMFLV